MKRRGTLWRARTRRSVSLQFATMKPATKDLLLALFVLSCFGTVLVLSRQFFAL